MERTSKIPDEIRALLAASSWRFCQNPNCNTKIFDYWEDWLYKIWEYAHIEAYSSEWPRWNVRNIGDNTFENLIMLCPTCHTEIDKYWRKYPVELLKKWKKEHSEKIADLFSKSKTKISAWIISKFLLKVRYDELVYSWWYSNKEEFEKFVNQYSEIYKELQSSYGVPWLVQILPKWDMNLLLIEKIIISCLVEIDSDTLIVNDENYEEFIQMNFKHPLLIYADWEYQDSKNRAFSLASNPNFSATVIFIWKPPRDNARVIGLSEKEHNAFSSSF